MHMVHMKSSKYNGDYGMLILQSIMCKFNEAENFPLSCGRVHNAGHQKLVISPQKTSSVLALLCSLGDLPAAAAGEQNKGA
jgi:hypothetical protein